MLFRSKKRKEKKLEQSLPKSPLSVIGSNVKEPKERKADGLIVMPQTGKVVINLVVDHQVKSVRNTLHVDRHLVLVKNVVVENHGAKKDQKERGRMNQWN